MFTMLRPRALRPPSANSRDCTASTIEMHSAPGHGPRGRGRRGVEEAVRDVHGRDLTAIESQLELPCMNCSSRPAWEDDPDGSNPAAPATAGHRDHGRVQAEHPDVHRSTVYRTLDALEGLGVLHRIPFGVGGAVYHLVDHAHHHLVCTRCGWVVEAPAGLFAPIASEVEATTGFELDRSHVMITGVCPTCRATAGPPAPAGTAAGGQPDR